MLNNAIAFFNGVGVAPSTNSYESIATVTLSTAATSLSFSSIPSTYKHLQIRGIAKAGNADQGYFIQLNGDTATNYNTHFMYGNGATVVASSNSTWAGMDIAATSSTQFTAMITDVLDYTDTNKNTTIRTLSGVDNNGSGYMFFASGLWRNTAAVNSITIREYILGGNLDAGTTFALYGIKG